MRVSVYVYLRMYIIVYTFICERFSALYIYMCVCCGRSRGPCRQLQRLLVLQHENKLFWAKDLAKVHFDEAVYHIYISLSIYIYIVLFSRCEVRTFWIELTEYDRIEPSAVNQVVQHTQTRFRVWILWLICKGFFAKVLRISAKAVAKEKVPMETHSPHDTFVPSREPGNNETLWFPGGIIYHNMALHLPLAVCSCRLHSVWADISAAKKWTTITPRKKIVGLREICERFLFREEWPFVDERI